MDCSCARLHTPQGARDATPNLANAPEHSHATLRSPEISLLRLTSTDSVLLRSTDTALRRSTDIAPLSTTDIALLRSTDVALRRSTDIALRRSTGVGYHYSGLGAGAYRTATKDTPQPPLTPAACP